jgi:predicted metal-dependent peptidase
MVKIIPVKVPAPRAGSGSDGQRKGWEEHCEEGGDDDENGISKSRRDMIRRQTAEEVRKAKSSKPGSVPGGIVRWADEILSPRVDWRKELAATLRNAVRKVMGQSDFTYRRPSRRQAAVPKIVLPAMDKYLPFVAVVVDTSGSMSQKQLAQGLAEIKGVLNALGHGERVIVFSVDAQASACQTVFNPNQVKLTGGGGTDMGVGIEAAAQHRPTPNIIIVFTDGMTPWPSKPPPRSKVTICICSDRSPPTPSWASTVRVPVAE